MSVLVSVIICSRDRAAALAHTLQAIDRNRCGGAYDVELIVVDNASADDTAEVVRGFRSSHLNVRYIYEPRRGKSVCLNRALSETTADLILLTDDDVRPHEKWIPTMCAPLLEGRADAVAGGITMAPHLRRQWMENIHLKYLGSTEAFDPSRMRVLIGASCAFSRRVMEQVGAFDPELGPGALGFCEDVLFSRQLLSAGYRLTAVFDHPSTHHFDPSRLSRRSFVGRAEAEGRSCAYIAHHWDHRAIRFPFLRMCSAFVGLQVRRRLQRTQWPHSEGVAEWEFWSVYHLAFLRQYRRERRRGWHYPERTA